MKYESWNLPTAAAPPEGISPLVGQVLAARGITDPAQAREFLRTDEGLLSDPFLLRDMDKAVARLQKALEEGETLAIYGDYDVDGMTAACLLYHFFTAKGANVVRYIPRRLSEGYGLNTAALRSLRDRGCSLVVTVDCGITAVEEADFARSIGLDLIITDHHTCKDTLPDAVAVIDPQRHDCPYPFKGLAGVGVALKLAMAMGASLSDYVHLAALGTVADVMPLVEENRAIVALGLQAIPHHPGLAVLLEEAGSESAAVSAGALSFTVCPRLNAAGRLGVTQAAEELLLARSREEALPLAQELCRLNRERQQLEADIAGLCAQRLDSAGSDDPAIVLSGEGWHQGVIGIVASRLAEKYDKPAFIISLENGMGKGSCRSAGGISLFHALEHCADVLSGYGGHDMAAGFTVTEENIPLLREKLNRWVAQNRAPDGSRQLQIDCVLEDAALLSLENVESLSLLEPFGAGNPKPVFCLTGCVGTSFNRVGGQGRHLKLGLTKGDAYFPGIFFSCPPECFRLQPQDEVDIAFTPQINHYRGRSSVQLQTVALRRADPGAQEALYHKFWRGDALTPQEAAALIPSREEFEGMWRFLRARAPMSDEPPVLARSVAARLDGPHGVNRAMVGLRVFEERGLIQLELIRDTLSLTLRPLQGKVDLEECPILQRLRLASGGG